MTRLGAVFWLIVVLATGFATFKAKYAIQDIEDELYRVRKQTVAEQAEIRVLNAEWTVLTQPERLAELNKRFLTLGPVATKQMQRRIDDIPLRPPPAPAAEPAAASDVPLDDPPAAAQPASPPQLQTAHAEPVAAPVAQAPIVAAAPPPPAATATPVPLDPAVMAAAPAPARARVRLAKATVPPPAISRTNPGLTAASLDALIAQIAEAR